MNDVAFNSTHQKNIRASSQVVHSMGVDIISEAFFIARTGHRHVELTAKEDSMNAVALTPSFVHIFNSNANLVIFFIITFFAVLLANTKLYTPNKTQLCF